MEFYQLDVFADAAYGGNQLAVFPDAPDLSDAQMQAIAREMNLSETTFVTGVEDNVYSLRIFTPAEELPFAGIPRSGPRGCCATSVSSTVMPRSKVRRPEIRP